jgi:hypothetical protein
LVPHVVELLGDKELVNDSTVEPYIQGLQVCTPVHHICLAIESAGPHSLEGPSPTRLVHTYTVDHKDSDGGRILRSCYRFLPG